MVMGGDSFSEGRGFKSHYYIQEGHFSHVFVVKIIMFVWKDDNHQKEPGDGPFKNNKQFANNPITIYRMDIFHMYLL